MHIFCSLVLAGSVITLLIFQVQDFQARRIAIAQSSELPSTAILFTGQFDRVYLALDLFNQGRIDRLFISGANAGAGIVIKDFASQFHVSPSIISGLAEGKIILASQANTTLENALETACWLESNLNEREILLITGQLHMPRASLALQRAVDETVEIVRISPEHFDTAGTRNKTITEFQKFVVTAAITILPQQWWTRHSWECH